jgi:hypothetical protein
MEVKLLIEVTAEDREVQVMEAVTAIEKMYEDCDLEAVAIWWLARIKRDKKAKKELY